MKTIEASTSRCSKDQDFLQKSYVNKSFLTKFTFVSVVFSRLCSLDNWEKYFEKENDSTDSTTYIKNILIFR